MVETKQENEEIEKDGRKETVERWSKIISRSRKYEGTHRSFRWDKPAGVGRRRHH